MTITAVLQIELHIPSAQNLKDKRRVIKSLKDRIASKFNVSVAEVGYLDKWQRAALAIAMVSNDQTLIESSFRNLGKFIERETLSTAYIISQEIEFL